MVNKQYRIIKKTYQDGSKKFFIDILKYGILKSKWVSIQNEYGYDSVKSAQQDLDIYRNFYNIKKVIKTETILRIT